MSLSRILTIVPSVASPVLGLILLAHCAFVPALLAQAAASSEDPLPAGFAAKFAGAEKQDASAVRGLDGWLFVAAECRMLSVGKFWGETAPKASRSPKPETADPTPAIVDFQRQLKARGIDLLLVPVPPKAAIYPEKLLADAANGKADAAPFLSRFYDELRGAGVDVLDLMPLYRENRAGEKGAVFCKTDTHWSGVGCVLAAQAIAEKIRAKLNPSASPTVAYASEWKELSIDGDLPGLLASQTASNAQGAEKIQVRSVTEKASGAAVKPNADSQVLVIGDSHTLVFHEFLGERAGLVDQLAVELGEAPDLIGIRGSGATQVRKDLYRRSVREKEFLSHKKVVVWCFTAREFTEADQGWPKLPVAR